jgi:hypothetical protein
LLVKESQLHVVSCLHLSFEHSLVVELGYNGFERLRRGFDRAFGGRDHVPTFPLVVDAGCGTGLVGEQVCDKAPGRIWLSRLHKAHFVPFTLKT